MNHEVNHMKKILQCLFICMAILISTCGIVSADENTFTGAASDGHLVVDQTLAGVSVTYNVQSETYTIYYPGAIQFSSLDAVVSDSVRISKATLKPDVTLNVTVISEHSWKLVDHDIGESGSHPSISYEMQYWFNGAEDPTSVRSASQEQTRSEKISVLTLESGLSEISTNLKFSIVGAPPSVFGSYEDRLTFEVSVERP